jgi:hypothetical protein
MDIHELRLRGNNLYAANEYNSAIDIYTQVRVPTFTDALNTAIVVSVFTHMRCLTPKSLFHIGFRSVPRERDHSR